MGISRHLEERLARLEARVKSLLDPEAEREKARIAELHSNTWWDGGSFEDIPEKDRDPGLWKLMCEYNPTYLQLVWEGYLGDRDEWLAAGVDFTRARGIDEDEIRDYINRTSGPNTPHKP